MPGLFSSDSESSTKVKTMTTTLDHGSVLFQAPRIKRVGKRATVDVASAYPELRQVGITGADAAELFSRVVAEGRSLSSELIAAGDRARASGTGQEPKPAELPQTEAMPKGALVLAALALGGWWLWKS